MRKSRVGALVAGLTIVWFVTGCGDADDGEASGSPDAGGSGGTVSDAGSDGSVSETDASETGAGGSTAGSGGWGGSGGAGGAGGTAGSGGAGGAGGTAGSGATGGGFSGSYTDAISQSFTASNGLTSQYHRFAQDIDPTHSVGLMMQFHGDGAYEFHNPNSSYSLGGEKGLRAQAKNHNMILVVALTPDTQGEVTWWESGSENADYARDLIQSVAYDQYNIDTTRVWLVGYSGGAQFITQFLLPLHSSLFDGGGSVVFGGGGKPYVKEQPFAASLRNQFPMHWYTGADDTVDFDALQAAKKGVAYYTDQGFQTSYEWPPGVNHNLSGKFGPVTGEQLDLHDNP